MCDRIVRCCKCDTVLRDDLDREPRLHCPQCGSIVRRVEKTISCEVSVYKKFRLRAKRPGIKRPIKEVIFGDEYQALRKKWALLERILDRENNKYHEKVVDPKTGEVYYECNEPLSEHLNHGSAKRKKNKD